MVVYCEPVATPVSSTLRNMIETEPMLLKDATIAEANDGTSAVEIFVASEYSQPLDCLFLDVVMINMHGPECASILRSRFDFQGDFVRPTVAHYCTLQTAIVDVPKFMGPSPSTNARLLYVRRKNY
jgi:hypothetical protein